MYDADFWSATVRGGTWNVRNDDEVEKRAAKRQSAARRKLLAREKAETQVAPAMTLQQAVCNLKEDGKAREAKLEALLQASERPALHVEPTAPCRSASRGAARLAASG